LTVGVVKAVAARAWETSPARKPRPAGDSSSLSREVNALLSERRSRSDWCRCQPLDSTFATFGLAMKLA
jgi:hypothetical protein